MPKFEPIEMTSPIRWILVSTSSASSRSPGDVWHRLVEEAAALDRAVYDAVANTPSPTLDMPMAWISNAADFSRLWVVIAGVLAVAGGHRGRRAAIRGLTAVAATSITANLAAKHIFPRHRPKRLTVTAGRDARMPTSSSFPSGHTASAFAFASAVTADFPRLSLPLYALATAVGYSRVHTGVHYPSDVMGGGVLGLAVGTAARETAALRVGSRSRRPMIDRSEGSPTRSPDEPRWHPENLATMPTRRGGRDE